jgi:hypothetical protein
MEALRQDPTLGAQGIINTASGITVILTVLCKIDLHYHPTPIILDALDEWDEEGAAHILRLMFHIDHQCSTTSPILSV